MSPLSSSSLDPASTAAVLVGFSGGLDSTVLLHLLAGDPAQRARGLRALHVHHGLQAGADDWAAHCEALCRQLDVPLQMVRVEVANDSGQGPEAAARSARHAAFEQALRPGEWLALAHHLDDQAETFLLHALRGSGIDGLAAMRGWRRFAGGCLWRPLLHVPRAALLAHAERHHLRWIEDPSNARDDFDRNFLRLQVMPLLRERWPHAAAAFARSAALAAEAGDLLVDQQRDDLAACLLAGTGALSVPVLAALPPPRRAGVLRAWIRQRGLPPLPANGVRMIERQLLPADHDRQAAFRWRSAQVRRWRDQLHALALAAPWPDHWQAGWDGRAPLPLPDGGSLQLLGAPAFEQPLTVRARRGGERIVLPGRRHSHALKGLLQQAGLPPWQRQRLPLLCAGDEVLAAGDRIVSAPLQRWLDTHSAELSWHPGDTAN